MVDLKNPHIEDFTVLDSPKRTTTERAFNSFFKVKPGSYTIPHTEHPLVKLPKGIL